MEIRKLKAIIRPLALLLAGGCCFSAALASPSGAEKARKFTPERRLAWCHSAWGMDKNHDWDATCRFAKEQGFTDLLVNLAWGGCAFYPSKVLPRAEGEPRGDALEQCKAACRRYGLKMHVWKVCWNHGAATSKAFSEDLKKKGRLCVSNKGQLHERWSCPSDPKNRRLEVDAMVELALEKGVDGIHFDYIRYCECTKYCFCDGCRARFERQIGRKVKNWPKDTDKGGPLYDEWVRFRCGNVTAVVREVSEKVRKARPDVEISAAVFRDYKTTGAVRGQDWLSWCREGLLDFICPMDYTDKPAEFWACIQSQRDAMRGLKTRLYPGLSFECSYYKYSDPQLTAREIQMVREAGLGGFAVFQLSRTAQVALPQIRALEKEPTLSLLWQKRFTFDAELPLPAGMTFLPAAHYSATVERLPGEMRFERNGRTLLSFAAPTNVVPPYEMHVMLTGHKTPAVFVTKDGVTTLAGTPRLPKGLELRRAAFTNTVSLAVSGGLVRPKAALSAGIGQADTRFVTRGRTNVPYVEDGRLFFTFSARAYGAYVGVMSFDPKKLDFRLEGVVLFDYGDGLLREDLATDIFYDETAGEWRGYASNFSTTPDSLSSRDEGGINVVWSKTSPLHGVSVMRSRSLGLKGMSEDPDGYWDPAAGKWRLLVSEFVGKNGIRAALLESANWDGPFRRIAGPVAEDSTGTTLASVGGRMFALAGSADRAFYAYDYPTLVRAGRLSVENPPWERSSSANGRSWPAYAELPDGQILLLTFDRVNFPGMPVPNWTYGGLYLYGTGNCQTVR